MQPAVVGVYKSSMVSHSLPACLLQAGVLFERHRQYKEVFTKVPVISLTSASVLFERHRRYKKFSKVK
jgi:hypothetical protein